ncbi:MAG: response regulator [Candidatus Margulisbacteria bacterium]|nr:response regulator [Candidatus Margulisiibacteriota bacterium]MBU1866901.1 response regulator [Candidatus Margulisiibacteriota bacterium]
MYNILVVDDELSIRESFALILKGIYHIFSAASGEAALKLAADHKIDLVYLDFRMPGINGLETLKRLKQIDPSLEVIMITAVNDVQKASAAIKLGANNYIIKPFDVDAVLKMTERLLQRKALIKGGEEAQKKNQRPAPLVGQSEAIISANKLISKAATTDGPVLIVGEAGTEKSAAAELIHSQSGRQAFPMHTVYLRRDFSPERLRRLLLGRSSGNNTIDLEKTTGWLEKAKDSSIFINNFEFFPAGTPVGSARLIAGSARIIPGFDGTIINLPPLRDRTSDLPLLINHFLENFSDRYGLEIRKISQPVEDLLFKYQWPGNTRELELVIERFFLDFTGEAVSPTRLAFELTLGEADPLGSGFLESFENEYLHRVYEEAGSTEKAAAALNIPAEMLTAKL